MFAVCDDVMDRETKGPLPTRVCVRVLFLRRFESVFYSRLQQAVAKESGATFINVTMAAVNNKFVGETEKYIAAIFTWVSLDMNSSCDGPVLRRAVFNLLFPGCWKLERIIHQAKHMLDHAYACMHQKLATGPIADQRSGACHVAFFKFFRDYHVTIKTAPPHSFETPRLYPPWTRPFLGRVAVTVGMCARVREDIVVSSLLIFNPPPSVSAISGKSLNEKQVGA